MDPCATEFKFLWRGLCGTPLLCATKFQNGAPLMSPFLPVTQPKCIDHASKAPNFCVRLFPTAHVLSTHRWPLLLYVRWARQSQASDLLPTYEDKFIWYLEKHKSFEVKKFHRNTPLMILCVGL
jgi:hypothetical protein